MRCLAIKSPFCTRAWVVHRMKPFSCVFGQHKAKENQHFSRICYTTEIIDPLFMYSNTYICILCKSVVQHVDYHLFAGCAEEVGKYPQEKEWSKGGSKWPEP